mmetsp:Transcript_56991/g.120997  ORF Transcript_56991/g.120997 Transcript_56991/m.120997 type:complete len:309 (-) Transcript_56991:31-957(-)
MKLILLKLTSYALVATSGARGDEVPSSSLRGSDVTVGLEASCEDGYKAGQKDVQRMWKNNGSNCDNVWDLEQEAKKTKNKKYPDSGDWKTKSFNECARDGVDAEVKKLEKKCLEDDSSQCTDLGKAAAEHIVKDNHCDPGKGNTSSQYTNYKKECKKAAKSICEGQIPVVANRWCPQRSLKTSKLREMQGQCQKQINKMVPGDESHESESEISVAFEEVDDGEAIQVEERIQCIEPTTRFRRGQSHAQACKANASYPVRFVCEKGDRLCCSRGGITEARLGKFGKCQKVRRSKKNDGQGEKEQIALGA